MCLTRISHILERSQQGVWRILWRSHPARAVYGVSQIHHGVNIEMEVVAEM